MNSSKAAASTPVQGAWEGCARCFHDNRETLAANLSRATSLLIVLHTSIFILNGTSLGRGYVMPFCSLVVLGLLEVLLILPLGLNRRFGFHLTLAALWMIGAGMFLLSLLHWLKATLPS